MTRVGGVGLPNLERKRISMSVALYIIYLISIKYFVAWNQPGSFITGFTANPVSVRYIAHTKSGVRPAGRYISRTYAGMHLNS